VSALPPRRALVIALILGTAARLAILALALPDARRFFTLDAEHYVLLAGDLQAGYFEGASSLFPVGLMRTPGYPLFAAAWLGVGGPAALALGQVLLAATEIALVFALARRLFDAASAGCAAILFALDPASAVYTCLLQPETLFTLLLLAGALSFREALDGSARAALVAGILFGLATLTRPIAVLLPLALVAVALRPELRRGRRLPLALALLAPYLLLAGGWVLRNARVAGAPVLSTIEGTNLLYYRAAGALAEERGVAIEDARAELEREMAARVPPGASAAVKSRIESERGLALLAQHPRGAALSMLRGGLRLLAGTGLTALSGLRGDPEPERLDGAGEKALAAAFALLLGSLYLGAAAGASRAMREGARPALLFLAAFIAYFLLLSAGPEANTRFRVPIAPFVAVLAGFGWSRMLAR
jgi:4-amino-4-deoxy-L-arabinose transferase-like glycosyltransferase